MNPFKNKLNQRGLIIVGFTIILLLIILVVSYQTNIYIFRQLFKGITNIIHNNLFILTFYVAVLFIFREQLNFNNPTLGTFLKLSLIIVSSYFSYKAFLNLNTPYFVAVVGGISFALGVQQLAALIFSAKTGKLIYDLDGWLVSILLICLVAAMGLDMSMTAVNMVLGEGKYVIFQESLGKRTDMEKARAMAEMAKTAQKQIDHLSELTKDGQYWNARYHADNYFKKDSTYKNIQLSDQEKTYLGPLQKGFTDLSGSEKLGKFITVFFILFISFALTMLIVVMEIKEQYSVTKSVSKSVTQNMISNPKLSSKGCDVTPPTPQVTLVTGYNEGNTQGNNQGNTSGNSKKKIGFQFSDDNIEPTKLQKEIIEVYEKHKEKNMVYNLNISKLARLAKRSRKFVYTTLHNFTDFEARDKVN